MKAILLSSFGGRDQLKFTDVEKPIPGEGEVLVRIKAAGVNPVDFKIREGFLKERMPNILPLIPGWDMAGEVESCGYSARRFSPGDRVFAYARRPVIQKGTYAQYIALPESYVAHMPKDLSYKEAASIPLACLTAYQSVIHRGGLQMGERCLVMGASGGVGSFAVQLARIAGASVVAMASGPNEEYVRSLGCEGFIDYTRLDAAGIQSMYPDGFDLVFDCVGKEKSKEAYGFAKVRGRIISLLSQVDEELARSRSIEFHYVFVEPNVVQLSQIARWVEEGKIKTHVTASFPLADAALAHEQIESFHTRGKIVLTMD